MSGRGLGHGGGLATVLGASWKVLTSASTEYFIGVVFERPGGRYTVVNVYLPPVTSAYAPKGAEGFHTSLTQINNWVTSARLQLGTIGAVLWVGDFNARLGQLVIGDAADVTNNHRGTIMLQLLRSWNLTVAATTNATQPARLANTHQHSANRFTTVDYVWHQLPAVSYTHLTLPTICSV